MVIQRYPIPLQAAYSELEQLLQDTELIAAAEGDAEAAPSAKTVKGKTYWYLRKRIGGEIRETYLGPDSPALRERIERLKEKHAGARAAKDQRRKLVQALAGGGYPRVEAPVGKLLEVIAEAGIFRLGGVLVGTHAFRLYGALLGVRLPAAAGVTGDVDIAQLQTLSLAVGDTKEPGFEEALQKAGPFSSVPSLRNRTRSSKWTTPDRLLSVELLTPLTGKDADGLVRLPALKAYAQPLRFLDFLIEEPVTVAALHGSGVLLRIPDPARYACHKLIVAARRSGAGQSKVAKDLAQAQLLIDVLREDRPDALRDAFETMTGRGTKWCDAAHAALSRLPAAYGDWLESS